MPPPTASLKPSKANGKDASASKAAVAPPASTPAAAATGSDEKRSLTKPDQAQYNAEQDEINKEIASIKSKLDAVRSRIQLSQSPGGNDRRSQIKAEMDALRTEQGSYKSNRQKTFDEMKRLQEGVQKKIKDAQTQRGKLGFTSVAEVDQRIDTLNRQVESGTMKLVDEKKALQEMSNLRRTRKTLEASGSVDDAIAADKARIEDLKKVLDDPEAKKVSDKFDALKKEMDGLREEGNKAYEERNKLFDERNAYSAQLDVLYGRKRESATKYREDNDKYYAKVQADRQARNDRFKAEKAKEDAARREEDITRMREEAKTPAYTAEIEDTAVLINWFKGKYGGGEVPSTNAAKTTSSNPAAVEGVKAHEIRQVDSDFKGMTLKKKGDDEELGGFFGGGGGKSKKKGGKKGGAGATASGSQTPLSEGAASGAVNLPMSLLSALLSLGIPPPSGKDDIQRTIDDLETKKAWFEANSESKTKAEIERVEKLVAKMQKKNQGANDDALADAEEVAEEGGNKEPFHTAAVAGSVNGLDKELAKEEDHQLPPDASPTEEVTHVDSALEEILEEQAEAKA